MAQDRTKKAAAGKPARGQTRVLAVRPEIGRPRLVVRDWSSRRGRTAGSCAAPRGAAVRGWGGDVRARRCG